MKKIFTSLLIMLMMVIGQIFPVSALSYDESLALAKNYYSQKTSLDQFGDLLAFESLGLDSKNLSIEHMIATDYASEIAQTVIALTLHGDDPRNYQGINYVEMLENCVQSNGAFDKQNNSTYANYQVYGVYALYIVNSTKLELAADYLASLIDQDGAFGSSYGPSLDITGWVIESLTLVNQQKYQATIDSAMAYIQSLRDGQAGYKDSFSGVNANTQACVLAGLLTYDSEGVKAGKYNQNDCNPYDVLLSFQNNDGSFWSSYIGEGQCDSYATMQAVQTVGYYVNGSVYEKARQKYLALGEVVQPETKPEESITDSQDKNDEEVNKVETNEVKTETVKETSKKADVVQTDDISWLTGYGLLFLGSGILLLKGRKYFE
ncbi:prenyltransferase/squalene oxidase repeat-containing protein [Clostridium sp. AUH-JLR23]|uniref:prenyltransferase/squalene oxidase repeat-containing protein n=1 Tax=Clostridium sp. AUH-JLR23 TaxID=1505062 RepID=UPI003568D221